MQKIFKKRAHLPHITVMEFNAKKKPYIGNGEKSAVRV